MCFNQILSFKHMCTHRPRVGGAPKKESEKRIKGAMEEALGRDKEAAAEATRGVAKEFFHQGKAKQVRNCTHCKKPGVQKLGIDRSSRHGKGESDTSGCVIAQDTG